MDPEIAARLQQLLMPKALREVQRLRAQKTRFVHYTSAEAGIAILRSGRMLLRNSTMMNDFSEVNHGFTCLKAAYDGEPGDRLKAVLNGLRDGLAGEVEKAFDQQLNDVRSETYLVSISEHGELVDGIDLEDYFGRLSMWRAYASRNGIAFVFNNDPFLLESNAINAFTSPVVYATPSSFVGFYAEIVTLIEKDLSFVQSIGPEVFAEALINSMRFAVQSTKHPSFREEREWRVIYSPTLLLRTGALGEDQMQKVPTDILVLNGVPQRIYAIPFQNYPDLGFIGATIPELLNRVLIGPSPDAYPIAQAFVAELFRCGVQDAHEKVHITGVPLRD